MVKGYHGYVFFSNLKRRLSFKVECYIIPKMIDSILFKACHYSSPSGLREADILVEQGRITKIEPSLPEHAQVIVKERGLVLIPGAIDPHVHFREPGMTHKETIYTGSKAAASGGVTSFFEMPNTSPSATTRDTVQEKKKIAKDTSLVNYNFFIGASGDNLDELLLVENVPGIKIYVGSTTGSLLVDKHAPLTDIFSKTDKLIAVHSEDEAIIRENKAHYSMSTSVSDHERIRSVEAAVKCTSFLIDLAMQYSTRLHVCHLTTQEELALFQVSKPNFISTEVTPQHLFLHSPDCYEHLGTYAQINPPIREKRHRLALWDGLVSGVIDCIGSDHAPHLQSEKDLPFGKAPSGMPGVETSLPLLLNKVHEGACSLQDVVRWMCEGPARLFQCRTKGRIEVGYDADLVLLDLKKKSQILNERQVTQSGWSAFHGNDIVGWPIATYVNGQLVYREGDFFEDIKGKEVIIGDSLR